MNIFTRILVAILLTTLSGCQANLEWFVRNMSDKDVLITLRFDTNKEKYRPNKLPLKKKYVAYKTEIIKINYSTKSILNDSLTITLINENTYQILLPAKSTVELTYIIPTDYGYSTNVMAEFEQDGKIYSINSIDVFEKRSGLKNAGSLTLKNLIYYDYGQTKKSSH